MPRVSSNKYKKIVSSKDIDISKINVGDFIQYVGQKFDIQITYPSLIYRHKKGSWKDIPFMWQLIYIGYLQ